MTGEVLSDRQIKRLIEGGAILGADEALINPASLDLRIATNSWRLVGSTIPLAGQKIEDIINNPGIVDDKHEGKEGGIFYLENGQPHIFKLRESLNLPRGISAKFFNKSGRARIGTSVTGLSDYTPKLDVVSKGYSGDLFAEICPTAFPELVTLGETTFPQLRFYNGYPEPVKGFDLELLLREEPILLNSKNEPITFTDEQYDNLRRTGKFTFTADLSNKVCYFRGKRDNRTIDLSKRGHYDPYDFFEEASVNKGNVAILHPEDFVLIFPKEKIRVPPQLVAEIDDYSAELGDVKVHYAGLINPGHGYDKNKMDGDYIVFEVRARDKPLAIQNGQELAKFKLFKMLEEPETEYRKVQSTDYDSLYNILPTQFKKEGDKQKTCNS